MGILGRIVNAQICTVMAISSVIICILMLTILCHIDSVNSANIVVTVGSSVQVDDGETAILECSYITSVAVASPTLQWSKEIGGERDTVLRKTTAGVVVEPEYTHHSVDDTSNLMITSTSDCDSGKYWCNVKGVPDFPGEDSVDLTVNGSPCAGTITSSNDTFSEQGKTVYLTSSSTSVLETFNYSWEKDGSTIPGDLFHVFSDDNSNLTIYNILKSDEGYYVSIVNNSYGASYSEPFFLNVTYYGPQHIDILNVKETYDDGDKVDMTCTADGNPLPALTWSFSDEFVYKTDDTVPGASNIEFKFHFPLTVNCTATNTYDVVVVHTILKQSSNINEAGIIAGLVILFVILLLVIIFVLICCCYKRVREWFKEKCCGAKSTDAK